MLNLISHLDHYLTHTYEQFSTILIEYKSDRRSLTFNSNSMTFGIHIQIEQMHWKIILIFVPTVTLRSHGHAEIVFSDTLSGVETI